MVDGDRLCSDFRRPFAFSRPRLAVCDARSIRFCILGRLAVSYAHAAQRADRWLLFRICLNDPHSGGATGNKLAPPRNRHRCDALRFGPGEQGSRSPVDCRASFADPSAVSAVDSGNLLAAFGLFVSGVAGVLQRYTFVLFTSPRPTVFLTWLIFPGIVYAWRRGEKQAAVQAALLMLCAIGIDSLGLRRGLKAEYFILTDPLIIIAGLVLLDRLTDLRFHRWAYPAGVALVVLHVGISQAEPVKQLTSHRNPERICEWNRFYLPLLPMPWCDVPAKRP